LPNKDKIPIGVWVFHVIWATAVIIGVTAYLMGANPNKYTFLQTVILSLTLIAVVVYTHFTRKMQQTMVKQTNVNILPVFIAHISVLQKPGGGGHSFDVMELENIGNGVALNIRVDTIHIIWTDSAIESVWPLAQIMFDGMMSIRPTERVMINHRSTIGPDGRFPGDRFDWMDKLLSRADFDYELRIRFSDVLGNRYVQTIHTGVSGIWPDTVEESYEEAQTPIKPQQESLLAQSPLKYLRRRRFD
jgi:hypothetical protein